jgi:hypothetical protein
MARSASKVSLALQPTIAAQLRNVKLAAPPVLPFEVASVIAATASVDSQ